MNELSVPAEEFVEALKRQIRRKSQLRDGQDASMDHNPYYWLSSIIEEVGEVATDLNRQRHAGAVQECLDVAHSAMLLAVRLDPNGVVLRHIADTDYTV